MDDIKSALERALERADQMGKLAPEEAKRQNEIKYIPIGESIARRYLEHGHISILKEQLEKVDDEGKSVVTHGTLHELIGSISIEDKLTTERALEGITSLGKVDGVGEIAEEILQLFRQYAWQKKLWYEENAETMEKETKSRLLKAGISGSAVGDMNIENDERWAVESEKLLTRFTNIMNEYQKRLTQEISIGTDS